jgi:hypothetical protein
MELNRPRLVYLSRLRKLPVRIRNGGRWLGKVEDAIVAMENPECPVVGLRLFPERGAPASFVPWDRVHELYGAGLLVMESETGDQYPPFQPDANHVLGFQHLIGRRILGSDHFAAGTIHDLVFEVVGKDLRLAGVDTGLRGRLRRWGWIGLERLVDERVLPWAEVLPFLQGDWPRR